MAEHRLAGLSAPSIADIDELAAEAFRSLPADFRALCGDVVITVGGLTYYWLYGDPEGRPTVASKLNTLLQVCLVSGVLARQAAGSISTALAEWLAMAWLDSAIAGLGALAFVTTVVSGLDYVMRYAGKARRMQHAARAGRTA